MTKVAQSNDYLEVNSKYLGRWLTPMYYWKRIYETSCRSSWNCPYIVVILEIYLGEA